MNREQLLCSLGHELPRLPVSERDKILADYTAYFQEAEASRRNEEEVSSALGDPIRLARELRAESSLRQWEERRSLADFVAALPAIGGLVTINIFVFLPFLFFLGSMFLIIGFVVTALGILGVGLLLNALWSFGDLSFIDYHESWEVSVF